ncbi:DUF4440 domain-containing protein [Rhodococcus sp. NPDC127530]|uniref:DUF4440 domain-containing protein n=1 Tax=unclassified Rhodococcus (in: high G+C Gram-positive bacteria) TaxID=192944 RepID=UPI00364231C2
MRSSHRAYGKRCDCVSLRQRRVRHRMQFRLVQTVDIVGDTAVIHGVNTLTESGTVLARERFTDVFIQQNGTWMALSAQETAI